ncbi:MAG: sulfatase-like hydrolase/transferase [Chloroflexota bacterium]
MPNNRRIYLLGALLITAVMFAAAFTALDLETPNASARGGEENKLTASAGIPHNVILIIADDFGIEMSQLYTTAADLPPTPILNDLMSEGVLFNNAWTYPICTPTRAAILTGRYGFRTGVGSLQDNSDVGLQLSEFTIPEAISAGSPFTYTHANIGKWHLSTQANGARDNPNLAGYDHFSGLLRGGLSAGGYSDWTKVVNGTSVTVTNYATTETVDDAISWLGTQNGDDKPWFLWLAFNAPHSPFHLPPLDLHSFDALTTTQSVIDADPYPYYKAMVEAMDTEIGRLLNSLPADVRENTTIIFIGDNGSPGQVAQAPLTSQTAKGSLYDGGVHVPFMISGPQVVNPDREVDGLVNAVDLYSTILELMGIDVAATVPNTVTLDSVSLMPFITDSAAEPVREWILSERFEPAGAADDGKTIRNEQYKLIVLDNGDEEFYDLAADRYQAEDLLTAADPMSAEEEENYCQLFQTLNDLVESEAGQTFVSPPASCDAILAATATPTSTPTETATPEQTATPTVASTPTSTETPSATATATPESSTEVEIFLPSIVR